MRDLFEWNKVLLKVGVDRATSSLWAPHFAQAVTDDCFSLGDMELDDFLAQILHESCMLTRLEESLYYSINRLVEVGSKFPIGTRWRTVADNPLAYTKNPQALAEALYGGRFGNDSMGDGWKYRGSGLLGVTFKSNFAELQRITGLPLVAQPDLLRRPSMGSIKVCIAWWEGHVPDAVMGDKSRVRRAVNGGIIGLSETERLTNVAGNALA